jgi:hypothetical protein
VRHPHPAETLSCLVQSEKLALTIRKDRVWFRASQMRLGSWANTKNISVLLKRLGQTCFLGSTRGTAVAL